MNVMVAAFVKQYAKPVVLITKISKLILKDASAALIASLFVHQMG
jgi:hypothetical protein